MSPALIAEYQARLPDRALLRRKLHELDQLTVPRIELEAMRAARS